MYDKDIAYGFMSLSWVVRGRLLKKYNLHREGDPKEHVKNIGGYIARAREADTLADFAADIEKLSS